MVVNLRGVHFGEKNSIIYVVNVYNKNIKIKALIIVLPGSTRLWSNETGQHLF